MSDEDLGGWQPKVQVVFSDEELIKQLRATSEAPVERTGNWWAFFNGLPRPEQDRLQAEAARQSGYPQ